MHNKNKPRQHQVPLALETSLHHTEATHFTISNETVFVRPPNVAGELGG